MTPFPQTAATTFAFSSVFILLLWVALTFYRMSTEDKCMHMNEYHCTVCTIVHVNWTHCSQGIRVQKWVVGKGWGGGCVE